MAQRQIYEAASFQIGSGQPLIGIILEEGEREVVRYFTGDKAADAAIPQGAAKKVFGVIGAWSDLDWKEMEASFNRIRHDSKPTPPIEI